MDAADRWATRESTSVLCTMPRLLPTDTIIDTRDILVELGADGPE